MVTIKKNTNGDSRVAAKIPTFYEFECSNYQHSEDVRLLMKEFARNIEKRGDDHDWTKEKEPYSSMFYRDLCNTIDGKMNFEDGEWAKLHCRMERHHLLRNVPDDVDLIDVIEMVCDCVAAGLARSGEVRPLVIDESILSLALHNTVNEIKEMCKLDDE